MHLINNLKYINKLSKLFQPINVVPKNSIIKKQDVTSRSQRLMLDLGIIRQANPGCFHLLPLGIRAMEKLNKLVDLEMQNIEAQKIALPTLTNANLWKKSGRLELEENELFILNDRHNKKYVIGPTYEEAVSDLLASVSLLSYKQLPLRLYQITSKFRDEIKPRFGLMRSRQFIMKDLYTFDTDLESAQKSYDTVTKAYEQLFNKIGVKFAKVLGTTGNIGGLISHEYHYPSDIGEDRLLTCTNCNYTANVELSGSEKCPQCKQSNHLVFTSGIEVGHTFLLGEKYSNPLNAKYLGVDGKSYNLQMGCYGLGLSRIIAACVEVLSNENEIRWPITLAPYTVIIIPPKNRSKEEPIVSHFGPEIYSALDSVINLQGNIIMDDRTHLTIGKRLLEAHRTGYPFMIVIGSGSMAEPHLFELHDLVNNQKFNFTLTEMLNYITNKLNT